MNSYWDQTPFIPISYICARITIPCVRYYCFLPLYSYSPPLSASLTHNPPFAPFFRPDTKHGYTTMHLPHIKPTATYQTTAWRPFRSKFRPFAFQASGKREQNVISRQICKRKKKKRVKWRHSAANQFNPSCRVLSVLSNGPSVRGGTWIGARGPDLVSLFFIFLS